MKKEDVYIRVATIDDAKEILDIYAPYIKKTAITFEYDVPSLEEFKERMKNTLKKYPYIVIESKGEILGYAYTGAFGKREAYDWGVETSIYIKENKGKMGLGKKLYRVLEDISKTQNILKLYACIAYPEVEDKYLTKNSVQFHEHLGYSMVGQFNKCGYKFGKWYNMVWMEKIIGKHDSNPSPIIHFSDLSKEVLGELGMK